MQANNADEIADELEMMADELDEYVTDEAKVGQEALAEKATDAIHNAVRCLEQAEDLTAASGERFNVLHNEAGNSANIARNLAERVRKMDDSPDFTITIEGPEGIATFDVSGPELVDDATPSGGALCHVVASGILDADGWEYETRNAYGDMASRDESELPNGVDSAEQTSMTECDNCGYTDVRKPGTTCPMCRTGEMRDPGSITDDAMGELE